MVIGSGRTFRQRCDCGTRYRESCFAAFNLRAGLMALSTLVDGCLLAKDAVGMAATEKGRNFEIFVAGGSPLWFRH